MSLLGILGAVPDLLTAGANVVGSYNQIKTNDLNFKLQKDQYSYQKNLQKIMVSFVFNLVDSSRSTGWV